MGNDSPYVRSGESRNLLLLIGTVFGSLLFIQYAELLPYGGIFSSGKSQVAPVNILTNRNGPISSNDLAWNSTSVESTSNVETVTGKDIDGTNARSFNDTSDSDMDLPEDDDVPNEVFENDRNSTVDEDNNSSLLSGKGIESNHDSQVSGENANGGGALSNNNGLDIFPENREKKLDNSTNAAENGISPPAKKIPSTSKTISKNRARAVITVSEMNTLLRESRVSYKALKPRWPASTDQELQNARSLIENAAVVKKDRQFDVSIYRNFSEFQRSYELMEKTLKVYIYSEGEQPIFHRPPLKGIYASEGWFMKILKSNKKFVTKNPKKAHLFYLPFSSRMLETTLYVPNSHDRSNLVAHLAQYVETISRKYPFWNRTAGSDHFLAACHDWAPAETRGAMANCIRALCNADLKEGFQFGKDVSLPETYVKSPHNPLRQLGGKPPSQRKILAFFAGNMHGYLRPLLLKHWENKDPSMKIFGPMPKVKGRMGYAEYMKSSKYCICARGYEVNSPRVVEAIFYECVPVILSDNFVPPFFETLDWESFAVFVSEKDVPNLKGILEEIPRKRYLKMQQRVRRVQQHFLWHSRPTRYDVFHMVLHSVWYNRVFQTRDL